MGKKILRLFEERSRGMWCDDSRRRDEQIEELNRNDRAEDKKIESTE